MLAKYAPYTESQSYAIHLKEVWADSFWLFGGSYVRILTPMSGRVIIGQNHEHKGEEPVAVYCFTQLIQPGKREEAKAVFDEIRETRRSECEASRRRLGIREERVWFQTLPQGDMAVVYWEGDDPRAALQEFASSTDPFDEWLIERGREVYHFEPSQTLEADEEVFDAKVG
jgi:hypothetical protein